MISFEPLMVIAKIVYFIKQLHSSNLHWKSFFMFIVHCNALVHVSTRMNFNVKWLLNLWDSRYSFNTIACMLDWMGSYAWLITVKSIFTFATKVLKWNKRLAIVTLCYNSRGGLFRHARITIILECCNNILFFLWFFVQFQYFIK